MRLWSNHLWRGQADVNSCAERLWKQMQVLFEVQRTMWVKTENNAGSKVEKQSTEVIGGGGEAKKWQLRHRHNQDWALDRTKIMDSFRGLNSG